MLPKHAYYRYTTARSLCFSPAISHFIVQNSMTICANNLTLLYFVLQSLKANFSSIASNTEQFILFILMMEIEHSWVRHPAPCTASFPFIRRKPIIMTSD
ncbi:hypothetical protein A3A42_00035 [Candidatus Kaiserbacteria bacterium RIFCSPLOWO2_01_FULL_55_25]|nr:MAG: hypothetical protein A3A42_00035 [Candidatus Kaiserbacteria bacterium RIFCSPLOWO2_01_FULL_55_25]